MAYEVMVTPPSGKSSVFLCGGSNDQVALIYAGQVVKRHVNDLDAAAAVTISRDGVRIGPDATVGEITTKAI